ncbi:Uncharacterised protein [Chromobacterium violaceum]|uniref:Uncharacterized protein n=1 Tax=Chromobacterium violaceum TaxID=536 RepID=A0AAX2M796_CHRVL|nr:Uncharacterised protein [Chromobacterium violaceum]SUX31686.1 Uncharacterised protein [Chromobacterium violaceum]
MNRYSRGGMGNGRAEMSASFREPEPAHNLFAGNAALPADRMQGGEGIARPCLATRRPRTGFQGRDDKGSFIVCLIALSTMVDFTLRTSDSCISLFITKDDKDGRSGTTMRSR